MEMFYNEQTTTLEVRNWVVTGVLEVVTGEWGLRHGDVLQ